jgi:hypothetical protein
MGQPSDFQVPGRGEGRNAGRGRPGGAGAVAADAGDVRY